MTAILTAPQMQRADADTIASGTPSRTLMERAALAALDVLFEKFDTANVLFLCGGGNNGGDGFAMARFFFEKAGCANVCYLGAKTANGQPDVTRMSEGCAEQYALLPCGVRFWDTPVLTRVTAVVDAIFGIGLSRSITGEIAEVIGAVNAAGIPVLAVDMPSGVDAASGAILGTAMRAAHTVTMTAYKYGQWLYPGASLCGEITVADIGIKLPENTGHLLDKNDLDTLPVRPARAHKGTFGRVLIIGGSVGMSGAGYLAAKAAYRTGAGLVEIFAPQANRVIYQVQLPEALLSLYNPDALDEGALRAAVARADAIAIGMGLRCGALTAQLLQTVLQSATVPLLLDADALNELAAQPALLAVLQNYPHRKVITPHLGEMSRLAGKPISEIAKDLTSAASHMAKLLNATVVLKDARTVICEGDDLWINRYGNNGMATGGSGDVLAGVIAALLATGDEQAAAHGVLAHALAGDAARERTGAHGLMASDIIEGLCQILP